MNEYIQSIGCCLQWSFPIFMELHEYSAKVITHCKDEKLIDIILDAVFWCETYLIWINGSQTCPSVVFQIGTI